jgi:hypothetical protein
MRLPPKNFEIMDDEMAEVYRRMTPARRLQVASDLYASARQMLRSHLRAEHPEWSEGEVNREAARRLSHGAL